MSVTICDVGPRDGLQNEPGVLEPAVSAELVDRLAATGLARIEAVSFVHPERVPQMAGAEEVVAAVERREGVVYAGLVLNEKGYERFAATGLDEAHFSFGVTESFNRRNANASVEESASAAERIAGRARSEGVPFVVSLSVAFGCPFEGPVEPARVLELVERLVAAGADEIVLADTIGVAVPRQVRGLVATARGSAGASASTSTTRGTPASRTPTRRSRPARRSSTRPWAGSAVAPLRRAPPGTSPPRTSSTCWKERASTPESTSDALVGVAEWLEGVLGRELPGQVYRAGGFPAVSRLLTEHPA